MNSNTKIIIGGLVLVVIAFYGGLKYGESKKPTMLAGRGTFTVGGQFAGRVGGGRGGANAIFGEIISKDANGITVKGMDGSSKIILLSASTMISKQASGTSDDLVVGKSVSVTGTTNSDGSITATAVQLRPAFVGTTTPVTQ